MTRRIDYGRLMHEAMRGLIRQVLADVAETGLPGEHHFYITFDTTQPGVQIADWLRARYPEEMMIVIQHWFDGLEVGEDGFAITLNFGDSPEPLEIPFDAIRTFVDPSVEFGLRFEGHEAEGDTADGATADGDDGETGGGKHGGEKHGREAPMAEDVDGEAEDAGRAEAEVVSLDSFRK